MRQLIFSILLFASIAQGAAEKVTFPTKQLILGSTKIIVEVASTSAQVQRGLMYRDKLPADGGMLFELGEEKIQNFWMKNTFIPLSIGFFDKDRKLVDIQDMTPVKSEMQADIPSYRSKKPASYALEMNVGWFAKKKIQLGTRFELRDLSPAK